MNTFLLSALLLLISTTLRIFITNRKGTANAIQEIVIGLPVDLTFVAFSIVIVSSNLNTDFITYHSLLIALVVLLGVIQLGAIYKPGKEYIEDEEFLKAWLLWALNAIITFLLFLFLMLKVVK